MKTSATLRFAVSLTLPTLALLPAARAGSPAPLATGALTLEPTRSLLGTPRVSTRWERDEARRLADRLSADRAAAAAADLLAPHSEENLPASAPTDAFAAAPTPARPRAVTSPVATVGPAPETERAAPAASVADLAATATGFSSASPAVMQASVGPQPQATGQTLEVSSVNPNDGFTYSGSATYTVPTTTTTQYDEVDVGIGNINSGTNVAGTGTVNQTGGTLSLTAGSSGGAGSLYLGFYGGDTGFYNLSGGVLQAVTVTVGLGGTGTFTQTGGTDAVGSGGLFLGNQNQSSDTNGTGTYTLSSTAGTATLTAPNESVGYGGSGTFTQNGGTNTIAAGGTLSLGNQATGTYNLNGGTLATPSVSMVTTANGNTAAGKSVFNFNGGVLQAMAATTSFLSGLTTANVQAGGAFINTNGFNVTIPQALLHNATGTDGGLTKIGTGVLTLILSGANTYTGPTVVNAGTLQAGVASVAGISGAFGNNSAVTVLNSAGRTLALNNFNTQIGSLTGGGTAGGNVTLGSATLTVGGDNTSPAAYAGVISGTGGLAKIGLGTLTLSGANTYTGTTVVSAGTLSINGTNNNQAGFSVNGGTLLVNGTLSGTGTVTVQNSGSVLGGTGTISGQVNVTNSAALDPGSGVGGVGKLSVGALTLTSAAPTFDILTGGVYDQVTASTFLALGTGSYLTLNVTPSNSNYTVGQVLDLVHTPGVFSGTFSDFANNGLYTYGVDTFQANYTATDFTLTVTSVPEPATWTGGALLLATAALALRRRVQGSR